MSKHRRMLRLPSSMRHLNDTYIAFGKEGSASSARQLKQDSESAKVSGAYLAKRAKAKASSAYRNAQWDLVDATENGNVNLDDLEVDELPVPMQIMTKHERQQFVADKKAEREALRQNIIKLSEEREAFVEAKRKESKQADTQTFNDAVKQAVSDLAQQKGYTVNR